MLQRITRLNLLEEASFPYQVNPTALYGSVILSAGGMTKLVDRAVVDHLANEERLLAALSAAERRKLGDLLRKLLASEPFLALDPARGRDG